MKDFFNAKEQADHIKILACQASVEQMLQSNAPNKEERKALKYANTHLKKFTKSVFERLGGAYMRKLQNTLDVNRVEIVGRYAPRQDALSYLPSEDIAPKIQELQAIHCMSCEKCDYQNCAVYNMCIAGGIQATNENGGCPFKLADFDF